MAVSTNYEDEGVVSDINVTPLVDVTLVILIVFMITFPKIVGLAQIKVDVAEPGIVNIGEPERVPLILALKREPEGKLVLYRDQKPINEEGLRQFLAQVDDPAKQPAVLSADRTIAYGDVVKQMDLLGRVGLQKISLNLKQQLH